MTRLAHHSTRRRGRGYTLLELLFAMVAATTLMVGLSSSIFIALKATDPSNNQTAVRIACTAAVTDLMADIEFALSFSEQTPEAITFAVPDRDGDDVPETIRYAWSGTPGDPLTRQVNSGAVVTFIENVHVFQHNLPASSPNLLANAGMESGTTNWEAIPNASILIQSSPVQSGSSALEAWQGGPSENAGARQDVTSQLVNATPYEISAWLHKFTSQSPYDAHLLLRINSTGEGEQLFATAPIVINTSSYIQVKETVTPTWTGTLLSAYWEASGVANLKDLYIDDAVLRAKQNDSQYVSISLQVGNDSAIHVQSGAWLMNSPL